MRLIGFVVAALLLAAPVQAQEWKEYNYPDNGFSIHFPADPKISDATYKTADGTSVKARIYSLEQNGMHFAVTVADFSALKMSEESAIDQAVKQITAGNDVKMDIPHRVNSTYGRQLTVFSKDGSRSFIAVFFRNNKLYITDGKVLPGNSDMSTGDGAHFQQTLGWGDYNG